MCPRSGNFLVYKENHNQKLSISDKDSCNGDSGGPLVYREFTGEPWNQVGVVSYGTPECGKGIPAVYTRIEAYLDWIDAIFFLEEK